MKSLVVMTYYQLMHAIAMALTFEEKPNLYFSMAYLNPEESLLDRIRETEVFNTVVGITRKGERKEFFRALHKVENATDEEIDSIGTSLFDKYLLPDYADAFRDADLSDDIYVYNDFQWHYYYITKYFDHIIGVEDGYGSLLQQMSSHRFKGVSTVVERFIERGYYPDHLYRHPKVRRIISSKYFDELDDYYKEKLEVRDIKDIIALNQDDFRRAVLHIFCMSDIIIKNPSSLILSQPLDRAQYCNSLENYLLHRKYIRAEQNAGHSVYYKAHPADLSDPRILNNGAVILKQEVPVEVLNYQNGRFDRVVSFGSTGGSTLVCVDSHKKYFDKPDATPDEISTFIRKQVKGERLYVDVFLRIKDMSPDTYIYVYSWFFRKRKIITNICLVVPEGELEYYSQYYDSSMLSRKIEEYRQEREGTADQALWNKQLLRMQEWIKTYQPVINICPVTAMDDQTVMEEAVFPRVASADGADYVILTDPYLPAFRIMRQLYASFEHKMPSAVICASYTETLNNKNEKEKILLTPGFVGDHYAGRMAGMMIHRSLVEEFRKGIHSRFRLAEILHSYSDSVKKRMDIKLYMTDDRYLDIEDGEAFYAEQVRECIDLYKDTRSLAGQLALILYDYYNWQRIYRGKRQADVLLSEMDDLIRNECGKTTDDRSYIEHILLSVYQILAAAMMEEKAMTDKDKLFQKMEHYLGINTVDAAKEKESDGVTE